MSAAQKLRQNVKHLTEVVVEEQTSGVTKIKWTTDQKHQLLNSYEKRRFLWDPYHDDHKNRSKRVYAYSDMAAELGSDIDPEDIRNMIHAIRTQFNRELRRTTSGKRSRWNFWERLQFLRNVTTMKTGKTYQTEAPTDEQDYYTSDHDYDEKNQDNLNNEELRPTNEEEEEETVTLFYPSSEFNGSENKDQILANPGTSTLHHARPQKIKQCFERRCVSNERERRLEIMLDRVAKLLEAPTKEFSSPEDEDTIFAKFLVTQLKKLSPSKREMVKLEIQQLLLGQFLVTQRTIHCRGNASRSAPASAANQSVHKELTASPTYGQYGSLDDAEKTGQSNRIR